MKKNLLAVFLLSIACQTIHGQVTLTTNALPQIGTITVQLSDNSTISSQTISAPGGNQTWNFSTDWITTDTNFTEYVAASTLTGNNNFPSANLGVMYTVSGGDFNIFYETNSNGLYLSGIYQNFPAFLEGIITSTNNLQLPVPFSMGSDITYTSRTVSVSIYDINFMIPADMTISNQTNRISADAWGSLTTPSQTANVLRMRTQLLGSVDSVYTDTTYTGSNFVFDNTSNTTPDSHVNYLFLSNTPGGFVMSLSADTATGDVTLSSYTDNSITNVQDLNTTATVSVYPNPVASTLHFNMDGQTGSSLVIMDVSGKKVFDYNIKGINQLSIATSTFANGIYFYQILNNQSQPIKRGKFIVQN